MRLVPPNPGDPGAQAAPVEYRGPLLTSSMSVSAQLTIDLFQYLTFNYKYLYKTGKSNFRSGGVPSDLFKTKYTTGENVYTYISLIDRGPTHYFTAGVFPYRHKLSDGGEFSVVAEAGSFVFLPLGWSVI